MPLVLPLEEIAGVGPGKTAEIAPVAVGVEESVPFENANDLSWSFLPQVYTMLFQNAGMLHNPPI